MSRSQGTQLPVGAVATVGLVNEASDPANSSLLRRVHLVAAGMDSGVPVATRGGQRSCSTPASAQPSTSPVRSWFNSGWTLFHDIFSCVNADFGGDFETFIFDVHLDNSDLIFQQTFSWPFN